MNKQNTRIAKEEKNKKEMQKFIVTIKKLSVNLGSNFDAAKWLRQNR